MRTMAAAFGTEKVALPTATAIPIATNAESAAAPAIQSRPQNAAPVSSKARKNALSAAVSPCPAARRSSSARRARGSVAPITHSDRHTSRGGGAASSHAHTLGAASPKTAMSRKVASSAPVHAPLVRRNDTSPAAARRKPSAPQSVQSRPSAQAAASAATSRVRPSSAGSKRSSGANSSERRARRMRISSILSRPAALAAHQPRSQRRFAGLRRAFGANGPVHTPFFAVFFR